MTNASVGRRAAQRADRMTSSQTGERTGSRPKPPKAGARSASLEPGRSPGYPFNYTVAHLQLIPHPLFRAPPHSPTSPAGAATGGASWIKSGATEKQPWKPRFSRMWPQFCGIDG